MQCLKTGLILAVLAAISPAAFAQEPRTIKGTVTGPDDKPVEEAVVSVYVFGVNMEQMTYDIKLAKQLETCSSGLFSYTLESELSPMHRQVVCYVEKAGLSMGFFFAYGEETAIKLTVPQTLEGRVEDARGNPVADATVQLAMVAVPGKQMEMAFGLDPVPFFTTRTDAEGKFAFTHLPENCTADFMVKKPGLAPFTSMTAGSNPQNGLTFAVGQQDIVLTLPDPRRITGVVMDAENQPVGKVKVFVRESDMPFSLTYAPVETAEDGSYSFADLSPGSLTLSVVDPEWVSEPVTVDVRGDMGVPLKVSKGAQLTVTVMDGVTDKPVSSASVNIMPQQSEGRVIPIGGATGQDGTLKKRLSPGTYNVFVHAPGYRSTRNVVAVVEEGKASEVIVTLGASAKITGTVTDPDGQPVAGAKVFVLPGHYAPQQMPVTDEQGAFVLGWDPEQFSWVQGAFTLAAIHKEENLAVAEPIDAETKEIALALLPAWTVSGRVIAPDGKPIADARINVQLQSGRQYHPLFQWESFVTDQDGGFAISTLPPEQHYGLNIAGPKGYGMHWAQCEMPTEGRTITLPVITLNIADKTVTGKVVDVEDNPIEGAQLSCHGQGQPNLQVKSDKDGKFIFDAVCEGPLQIHAWYQKDGQHLYTNLNTEGGARDVTVVIAPRNAQGRVAARRPAPLAAKPLPDLAPYGLELAADLNQVLVCVWDWRQRPSRHVVRQIAGQAEALKQKSVQVVLLNANPAGRAELDAWLAEFEVPFACGIIAKDPDSACFNLGVQALPWLILTNDNRTVVAEGFEWLELTAKLEAVK